MNTKKLKLPENRDFGLIFSAVFGLIAIYIYFTSLEPKVAIKLAALSLLFLLLALIMPKILTPLNWLWMRLGLIMHKVISPLVLGFLYFVIITPYAILCKIFGIHFLTTRFNLKQSTYWNKPKSKDLKKYFQRQF